MKWLLNLLYATLLIAVAPIAIYRMIRHGRYRRGLAAKLLGQLQKRNSNRQCIWFHAVSVGEVLQLEHVIHAYRQVGTADIVVTTSTDTGYDLAVQRFPDCEVNWFPFDFSWAVRRAIQRVRPTEIVLVELELWPNFLTYCRKRQIPTSVINARLSERSFRGYSRLRTLVKPMFAGFKQVAAQNQAYADRFAKLGTPIHRIHVTGSLKFDGVETNRLNERTQHLRQIFGWTADRVFIAGSTQAPEEQMALDAWQAARQFEPRLKLILVPRHAERFDEVAELLRQSGHRFVRRSQLPKENHAPSQPVDIVLLDTIGELSACWGLADIAFVGGSFGSRGGQNMLEPAAFGAAVMFGPNTANFRQIVQGLLESNAAIRLETQQDLSDHLQALLTTPAKQKHLGTAAQAFVRQHKGAINRTIHLLHEEHKKCSSRAA